MPQEKSPDSNPINKWEDIKSQSRRAVWEAELNLRPKPIESEQAEIILDKTEIHADRFKGAYLTVDHLKRYGLEPKHFIGLGEHLGQWVAVSDPYDLTLGRIAVVAYVSLDDGNKITARSYYRSNSHGLWRYLPSYTINDHGDFSWYSKGFGEESISLPLPLQKSLSRLGSRSDSLLSLGDPSFVFAGTSRLGPNSGESYINQIEQIGKRLMGNFYPKDFSEKVPPEKILFENSGQKPRLSQTLATWTQESEIYGTINVEAIPSEDGSLAYMFCRDNRNRVWIGAVDNFAPIGNTGLRLEWVTAGDLTTPAYEYYGQDGRYGNTEDKKKSYLDMSKNYLSRVPIIQEYVEVRGLPPIVTPEASDRLFFYQGIKTKFGYDKIQDTLERIERNPKMVYEDETIKELFLVKENLIKENQELIHQHIVGDQTSNLVRLEIINELMLRIEQLLSDKSSLV